VRRRHQLTRRNWAPALVDRAKNAFWRFLGRKVLEQDTDSALDYFIGNANLPTVLFGGPGGAAAALSGPTVGNGDS